MQKKKLSVVPPPVLPVAERSEAERSEAKRSGEAGNTGSCQEFCVNVLLLVPVRLGGHAIYVGYFGPKHFEELTFLLCWWIAERRTELRRDATRAPAQLREWRRQDGFRLPPPAYDRERRSTPNRTVPTNGRP